MLQYGMLDPLGSVRIYSDLSMVEKEQYEVEVVRTFRERWVEPLLHGITVPFEPWVKTRTEQRERTVPSKQALAMPGGFVCHPAMVEEIRRILHEKGGHKAC